MTPREKVEALEVGKKIVKGGKVYRIIWLKRIGGKLGRTDYTICPDGEETRKLVRGVALNAGKMVEVDNTTYCTSYYTKPSTNFEIVGA